MTTPLVDDKLIVALRSTREGYEDERLWMRFLLDAYAGTGGFKGRIGQPTASYWGESAEIYSRNAATNQTGGDQTDVVSETYLDRYPREDAKKFERRIRVAQYPNFVEQIVDLRLSYLARKPMTYSGVEHLQEAPNKTTPAFFDDTGSGIAWSRLMHDVVRLRASVCGWMPMLFDMPPTPPTAVDGEISVAQAEELGIKPRAIPLWPANLLNWMLNEDGSFRWVKLLTCYTEQPDPLGVSIKVERFAVWTAKDVTTWEVETKAGSAPTLRDANPTPRTHKWGRVPLIIFRCRPKTEDPVRGISMVTSIGPLARRLFNYLSELDEHLRASTFAMLQLPTKGQTAQGKGANPPTVSVGAGNAIGVPHDSQRDVKWLSPDANVAEVYEARVLATIEAMHRIARMRFMTGVQSSSSGVAQSYEFQDLERAISDTALAFASGEQESLKLVSAMTGIGIDIQNEIRATPPERFDVEDLSKQIDETMRATQLDIGPTASAEMKKRLVRQLLPNLEEDILAGIDSEIDQAAIDEEAQSQAMDDAMLAAAENPPDPNADPNAPPPNGPPSKKKTPPPVSKADRGGKGRPPKKGAKTPPKTTSPGQ